MNKERLTTTIWDIVENNDNNIIKVELNIEDNDILILELDLEKVGITKDMDYAFQLSKDLDHIVNKIWVANNTIPTKEQVETEFYNINYMTIEI